MKKRIILALGLALALLLSGCGSGSSKSNDSASHEQTTQDQPAQEDAQEQKDEPTKQDVSDFPETVLLDNESCAVKVKSIDPDSLWGYTLKVELENRSADTTYRFSVNSACVNGVMCDPLFASEVAPGMKANEDINFPLSTLEDNGVGEPTDIEINFRVYDADDWTADDVAAETVHVYPLGAESAAAYVREPQPDDNVIVDNDQVSVTVVGYRDDPLWGYTADFYLVNKTDRTVMFSAGDVSVNGYMADPLFAMAVAPGRSGFRSMSWSDSKLEENGIEAVETIVFTLRAYDTDDWMAGDYVNQSVTLEP